jgi:hypothetical protein
MCFCLVKKTLIRNSQRNIYGQCGMNENRLELCFQPYAVESYFKKFSSSMRSTWWSLPMIVDDVISIHYFHSRKWRWFC